MRVTIETDNGHMEVDLDEFFPTSLSRMRRLFRLMRAGMTPDQLKEVRRYLVIRKAKTEDAMRVNVLGRRMQELEAALDGLKKKRNKLEAERRSLKDQMRREDQVARSSKEWIREFDYICGTEGGRK